MPHLPFFALCFHYIAYIFFLKHNLTHNLRLFRRPLESKQDIKRLGKVWMDGSLFEKALVESFE